MAGVKQRPVKGVWLEYPEIGEDGGDDEDED
jgi:hypothetical protein